VIDGDRSSLLDLSLFSLSLLTIYEWCGYRWQNDAAEHFFFSSSNHVVILSLFFPLLDESSITPINFPLFCA
jgi:hypothetical protein